MKNENKVVEMDLQTRKMIANGVIKNAKEIISVGLHGKETKKIVALVPVSMIKTDHQSYQREEKKHVIQMAKEWDDSQCTLLLVNYRSEEGWFYAIDGQHRTVAATILGIEYLACEIFIDLSVEEEAKRFLYYNTGTKALSPFDTFKANICWGEENDTAIKSVCDTYGIAIIDRKGAKKKLHSVSAIRSIYRNGGKSALEWIFNILEDVHWGDFKETYSADILLGMSAVYTKCISNLSEARKNLVEFMKNSTPSEIIGLANSQHPTLGHQTRVRLIFEEVAENTNNPMPTEKKKPVKVAKIA